MKNSIAILLFFTGVITCRCFSQETGLYSVKFSFSHSLRIPDNSITVNFERYGDSIQVTVKSMPMDTISEQWRKTKKQYSFGIGLAEFNKIVAAVKKINCSDIMNDLSFNGNDGTVCSIEMAGMGSSISYRVWTPDYKTQARNLQPFLDACKFILHAAKFDSKKCFN